MILTTSLDCFFSSAPDETMDTIFYQLTLKGAGGGEKRPPYGFSVFSQKIFKLTLLEIS